VRDNTAPVVPVRRRRSIFSIIGMLVVAVVVLVVAYFAWVGWNNKGKPTPDIDVKTNAIHLPAWAGETPGHAVSTI
jgi:flagellar basal body-associated protein FliL